MINVAIGNKIENFVVEQLQKRKDVVKESITEVGDIILNEKGLSSDGIYFDDKTTKQILSELNLKPDFMKYEEKLTESEWKDLNHKIKKAYGDGDFYTIAVKETDTSPFQYKKIFKKNAEKKKDDSALNVMNTTRLFTQALGTTDYEYSLKSLEYNLIENEFNIELLNEDSLFRPFNNDDKWLGGQFFNFSNQSFKAMSYYERLICTNGLTTKEGMFQSNITQNKFNNEKVEAVINKMILTNVPTEMLVDRIQRLKKFNVSIAEFLEIKKYLMKLDESQADNISKIFTDIPFIKAFGVSPSEQPKGWLKTADSGISGYDFLNMITWVASHDDVSQFKGQEQKEIQIKASDFVFAKSYDLENIAEKVKVDYPKLNIMI